jgi:hypothetical protein
MAQPRSRESAPFIGGREVVKRQVPVYEIYALKYTGPLKSKLGMLLWMEGWGEDIERNYYIWAIQGQGEILVVDAGMRVALAARSYIEDNPSTYITDMVAWLESYDKVRARASCIDLIFPGHDAQMLTGYPKVAEDVTRLV